MSFESNIGKTSVPVGPGQCVMINVHHPDCECASCKMNLDVQCLEPYVGSVPDYGDDNRVCGACAVQAEREGEVVSYRDETRFVVVHPEMGVYLGAGQWSKRAWSGAAITFQNRVMADMTMSTWTGGRPDGATIWPVVPDLMGDGKPGDPLVATHASWAACAAAGLEAWLR